MSRAMAVEQSKARLVANMILVIPTVAVLLLIWTFQSPKPAAGNAGEP